MLYLFSKRIKDYDLIKWYLDHGSNINEVDDNGNDALDYSIFNNSKKLARFVLSCPGYNTSHVDKNGKGPYHHVVTPTEYGSYENVDMVKILQDKGIDINVKDKFSRTAVMYAMQNDSKKIL